MPPNCWQSLTLSRKETEKGETNLAFEFYRNYTKLAILASTVVDS